MSIHKVLIGDDSHDGHGRTEDFYIEVNPVVIIDRVYASAKRLLGVDVSDHCEDYECGDFPFVVVATILEKAHDLNLPITGFDMLRKFANTLAIADADISEDGIVQVNVEDFFALWLTMVNIGVVTDGLLPFLVARVKHDMPVHDIGGYGLFWD